MSTRMYSYRVDKDVWWDVYDRVRALYLAEYPMSQAIRQIAEAIIVGREQAAPVGRVEALGLIDVVTDRFTKNPDEGWSVDFQVFDEGPMWLLRPLEHGRFLLTEDRYLRFPDLRPVFYNNGFDVPPEEQPNEAVARWVDTQIDAHRYFLVPVLDRDDYRKAGMNRLFELWDAEKTEKETAGG
jgi:hypothetical protein